MGTEETYILGLRGLRERDAELPTVVVAWNFLRFRGEVAIVDAEVHCGEAEIGEFEL